MDLGDRRRVAQLPGKRMLAPAAANDKNFHDCAHNGRANRVECRKIRDVCVAAVGGLCAFKAKLSGYNRISGSDV